MGGQIVAIPRSNFLDRFQRVGSQFNSTYLSQLDVNLIEHVLSSQCFGDAFRFMLGQGMIGIAAGNLEHPFIDHENSQRTKRHTGRHLNVVHVVNLKVAMLFDPVFDERIAQSVLGFTFSQVSAFHD